MKKFLLYTATILVAFLLQNNVFATIPLIEATPNLLLIVTFSFGFIRGQKAGSVVGFFCGLLMDVCYGQVIGYYAFIYTIIGYMNGSLASMFYTEFLNMPLLLCILSDFIYNLYIYVFGFLIRGRMSLSVYFADVILPEVVYTAVLTIICYRLFLWMSGKMDEWEQRSARRFV